MSNLLRLSRLRPLQAIRPMRTISTSKKNQDVEAAPTPSTEQATGTKNWMSYGFSVTDEKEDQETMHATTFMTVTVCLVFGGFILAYRPDELSRDWAQREGYLELRRRELAGLPLVDPNYIPEDRIKLPSDEELADTEIII